MYGIISEDLVLYMRKTNKKCQYMRVFDHIARTALSVMVGELHQKLLPTEFYCSVFCQRCQQRD